MNGPEISSLLAAANAAANAAVSFQDGKRGLVQREAELNSARIEVVADKLALYAQSSGQKDEARLFFQLCLSLARGIDYGVANNEVPEKASKLPPILKQVCRRKSEFFLQAAIMVLMISVKNACKIGWFTAKDTEELLTLANEVGSSFSTMGEHNGEVSVLPTVSTIISRFYPRFKMGHVIASLEVKPGYGTYLLDFHISKNVPYSSDEKIRLFVAMKDNIDTSSCIISPQKVNLLLNGKAVDKRTNIGMDQGPQFPTAVNLQLKYGTNLLQAVGHFSGHYIIVIAFMSIVPPSTLPVPEDYVQPATLSSESDSEIIEGPSRISLNCPISYKRIGTPVKGHLCKHYQCFDFSNYLELNSKRPSWRCPQCNQSVCFTDLRVDQRMAKVLQEVGENVSEVIISADGSWTAASSKNHTYESNDKASADQQEQHERPDSFGTDTPCKVVYDLTEEDTEMEIVDRCETVDIKPVIHQNVQNVSVPSNLLVPPNLSPSPASISTSENPYTHALVPNSLLSEVQTGSPGISSMLTDSVSPSLNRLPDSFQGTNYPTSSTAHGQFSASKNSHLRDIRHQQSALSNDFGGFQAIPRNVTRTPSAIQALAVPMPSPHQQYSRPTVSTHTTNMSSSQFQVPHPSNGHVGSTHGLSIERQRHIHQSIANAIRASNMSTSQQNRPAPRVVGHSTPNQSGSTRMPQMPQMPHTLSQPPHLRSSSQVPQNHGQQGVSHGRVITMEPIQLMAQHPPQMRQHPQTTPPPQMELIQLNPHHMRQHRQTTPPPQMEPIQLMAHHPPPQTRQQPQTTPPQTQTVRMASHSPAPQNIGPTPPQAVSRTENLIDIQSEQNWRPTGRMRGALTGQAYSAALSQFIGQTNQPAQQVPSPRPSGPPVSLPLSPHLQALANRMQPQVSQVLNRPPNNASNGSEAPGEFS